MDVAKEKLQILRNKLGKIPALQKAEVSERAMRVPSDDEAATVFES